MLAYIPYDSETFQFRLDVLNDVTKTISRAYRLKVAILLMLKHHYINNCEQFTSLKRKYRYKYK